jgi:hypothetical protein
MLAVALGGVIGVGFGSVQRIIRSSGTETAALGVEYGDADVESAEIDACDDAHISV